MDFRPSYMHPNVKQVQRLTTLVYCRLEQMSTSSQGRYKFHCWISTRWNELQENDWNWNVDVWRLLEFKYVQLLNLCHSWAESKTCYHISNVPEKGSFNNCTLSFTVFVVWLTSCNDPGSMVRENDDGFQNVQNRLAARYGNYVIFLMISTISLNDWAAL